jgi:predicted dehydrogenase
VPRARFAAAFDLDSDRAASFAKEYGGTACGSLDELLARADVDAVLNLTPPAAHVAITEAALRAGKHVFSEKPVADDLAGARRLMDLARARGLAFGGAPAVHRSPAGKVMRRMLRTGAIGPLSHVYCDLDDGPLHAMNPHEWFSPRGLPWPLTDEFETGSVVHHTPYVVAWATLFAGSITAVRGCTAVSEPDKCGTAAGPDLCLAVLEHESGCLTRLTVGALAPRRRDLVVIGRGGDLQLPDMWMCDGPVLHNGREVMRPGPSWPFDTTHRLNFHQGAGDFVRCLSRRTPAATRLFTDTYGALALHTQEVLDAVAAVGAFDRPITTRLGGPA